MGSDELEWKTRKKRIDPKLDAAGWPLPKKKSAKPDSFRSEEEETNAGPADYALWLRDRLVGIVEAKKVTVGPQNVLTQAERYARGLRHSTFNFDGMRCPFLYSTNGEVLWFHDVRHPLNRSRKIARFHTANALEELLGRDFDTDCDRLLAMPNTHKKLRPYQKAANEAIEKAIAERKRSMLVAMATGTGKTFTMVNQIYRLLESKVARRVLFLVDRRALAAQAVRAFSAFDVGGKKFDQVYEVYSSRFQKEDFGEEEKFDPNVLPPGYLKDPKPGHAFVYVCTIQRMAINLFGREAVMGDDEIEDDVEIEDIPIHAFDTIVADECHRGYTAQAESIWRSTLDHFDAIKIGLTATPAAHTMAYFKHKAFEYRYEEAVRDGHLVDYDVVTIRSEVRMKGVFLKTGESVEIVNTETGATKMDELEDERPFESSEIEAKVTAPESNKKILEEIKKHAEDHEKRYGRFPKTLIFAANDLPHTSHADQLVDLARDIFGKGDAFVVKITGAKNVDRPLQRIREFRNRPTPMIAVTVDLLTTGVDIPDLEFIVFLRPVKSRILFEQMLGRGTRKGEHYPDKDHFTVFDCFDGTLLKYFKNTTSITKEDPVKPSRTLQEIVDDIWSNKDRDYNIGCLVKRLQRIDKAMSTDARQMFAKFIPDGDVARYARGLRGALQENFTKEMKLLRSAEFQELLVNYERAPRTFYRAIEQTDQVSSTLVFRDIAGQEYKPNDYLAAFSEWVRENKSHIHAIEILLGRPRDWTPEALGELREKLAQTRYRFSQESLQRAHEMQYSKPLVDIISMVRHAADEQSPLLTAAQRVERAFMVVTAGQTFTPEQKEWLDRIRQHLVENLSIDQGDFEIVPVFANRGGWLAVKKAFGQTKLEALINKLNEAIAA